MADDPNALRDGRHWHRCARHRKGCPHRWECLTSACGDPDEARLYCSPCHPVSIEKRGDPLTAPVREPVEKKPPAKPTQASLF